ncbi:transposase, partial [Carboxydothermus pertinax]
GVRSLIDKDARVGYKSQTESFFGYKVEYTMTTDSRLILAVRVYPGSYVDGTNFEEILELALRTKVSIKKFFGDKAYFRKIILDAIKKISAKPYIPVSESVYRIDENKYSYNKDSDQWFCECGNYTVKKEKKKRNDGRLILAVYI